MEINCCRQVVLQITVTYQWLICWLFSSLIHWLFKMWFRLMLPIKPPFLITDTHVSDSWCIVVQSIVSRYMKCFRSVCLLLIFSREGNEPGDELTVTYRELLHHVCRFANVLKSQGEFLPPDAADRPVDRARWLSATMAELNFKCSISFYF